MEDKGVASTPGGSDAARGDDWDDTFWYGETFMFGETVILIGGVVDA